MMMMPSCDSHTDNKCILVIGEALVDIVINPHTQEYSKVPGGSPANVALGLGRLGKDVHLCTWIAPDEHGELVHCHLKDSNVHVTHGSLQADSTSTAKATINADSSATYEFEIDWNPSDPFDNLSCNDIAILHTGSIASTLEGGASLVADLIDRHKDAMTISYDPNIRPSIMTDHADTCEKVFKLVANADVVKASHEDLKWLSPNKTYIEVAQDFLNLGAKLVIVTLAENGVYATSCNGVTQTHPTVATELVDTVGAGDSFMAGILDKLSDLDLAGGSRKEQLKSITATQLQEIIEHASKIAAITVSRKGADLPYRHQL